MEDTKNMRKEIASGARLALIFGLLLIFFSPVVQSVLSGLDKNYVSAVFMAVLTALALLINRKKIPEGWFRTSRERIPLRSFFMALGIFAAYRCCTELLSHGVGKLDDSLSFIVYMGFVVPICEELIFRGIILGKYVKYGGLFALLASCLLFGAYHMNLIQLVSGFFMGWVFAYIGMRYHIGWSMALHIINNGLITLILPRLWNASGSPFLMHRGSLAICAAFTVIGLIAAVGAHPVRRVREYLLDGNQTEGAYRAAILNAWTILLLLIDIGLTVAVLMLGEAFLNM